VDVDLGGGRGAGVSSSGGVSAIPAGTFPEKRGAFPSRDSQRVERPPKGLKSVEGRLNSSSKSIRCARDRACTEHLVFGEDIDMDRVVDFSEWVVVGRVRGKKLGMAFLKDWVTKTWLPEITKMPHIRLLTRGWFAFIFSSTEDVCWVLKKVWSMADTPTILK
jgi:hypothetical protein